MRRSIVVLVAMTAAAAGSVRAQTDETLAQAASLYENLEIERARAMFLQVISPNSPFEVSQAQRVTAYLYLGATNALLPDRQDSALVYFRAAIERDVFADLDPQRFTDQERQVFALAKRQSYRLGLRPVDSTRFDPRSESMSFAVVSTHAGNMILEIASVDRSLIFPVFDGPNDGLRQVQWNGRMPNGTVVPAGSYQLVARGQSQFNQRLDSTVAQFNVTHDFQALEDTLRTLRPDDLLPERLSSSVARNDLFKGLGVAGAAFLLPNLLGNASLSQDRGLYISIGIVGAIAGGAAFMINSSNPVVPANVAENARRRLARETHNTDVLRRNNVRLADTRLIITPVSGSSR